VKSEPKVNSSHHQAIRTPGDNLRVVAVSPVDGVVEGVELDSVDHFVVGVQWHPERTYTQSAFSRAIFYSVSRRSGRVGTPKTGKPCRAQWLMFQSQSN
jgi:gamma-glutamyl-gamma-aminobutyrate hydrolase PuuD